jgi:GAF domain-containing protein
MDRRQDVPSDDLVVGAARRIVDVTSALDTVVDLVNEEDLSMILDRICGQVVDAIPGADMGSVTLVRGGRPETGAATTRQAADVDLAQYRAGEGPCLQAVRSGQVLSATSAEIRDRWPVFAEVAAELDVAGCLSAPLSIDDDHVGSLNLYSVWPHGFQELDVSLLGLYATALQAALGGARRLLRARDQAVQLREALASRAVIEQAKGVLMAVHRITADEAFALLVTRSQQQNVKLREVRR